MKPQGRPPDRSAALPMWTVYDHPKDYPKLFVARRFVILGLGRVEATDDMHFDQTLDGVRAKLPPGLYRLDRMPDDDPKIVEVWL